MPHVLLRYDSLEEMQFALADGTREVDHGKINRGTFLAPHVEAVHAFLAQDGTPVEAR